MFFDQRSYLKAQVDQKAILYQWRYWIWFGNRATKCRLGPGQ